MRKFFIYAPLVLLCFFFSCKNTTMAELKGVSILGQYNDVSGNTCRIQLKNCDNVKASDVKVHFTDGSTQNVKMIPNLVILKKNEEVLFRITNLDDSTFKFNIEVFAKLLDDAPLHSGDLRIWVPISSSDKAEAKQAIPDSTHLNDYTYEVPYNFEGYDLAQIWVLYTKEPNAKVKSDDLRFFSKANGTDALLLYHTFPSQGETLKIPLYIDSSEGPKVYNLNVKTSLAPENQNANIKSITFNGIKGVIEGKNITCSSSFPVGSTINVVPTLENTRASATINDGQSVVIGESGVTFTIVVAPEKLDGIRKSYTVLLEAPPNNEIKKVKALNYDKNSTTLPDVSKLLEVGEIEKNGEEKSVTIPLYTAGENVALHFETELEIANIFYMQKNKWSRLDSYSSSKKILTLREGVLKLPPALSNTIKLKVLFKNEAYDTITIKFKKAEHLEPVSLMGLYIDDTEIQESVILSYFNGSFPVFNAKGPKIFVEIVSKEALHASISGKTYKSVYSGFLSYGLSIPITMPQVNEESNIDITIDCDYAASSRLRFKVHRDAGTVDLVLYPSINGQPVGSDLLKNFKDGSNPIVSVLGADVLFSIDTTEDLIDTMKVNEEEATKKKLKDSNTEEEFYRFEFLIKALNVGEVKNIKVEVKPKNTAEYNNLEWRFKVKREN